MTRFKRFWKAAGPPHVSGRGPDSWQVPGAKLPSRSSISSGKAPSLPQDDGRDPLNGSSDRVTFLSWGKASGCPQAAGRLPAHSQQLRQHQTMLWYNKSVNRNDIVTKAALRWTNAMKAMLLHASTGQVCCKLDAATHAFLKHRNERCCVPRNMAQQAQPQQLSHL